MIKIKENIQSRKDLSDYLNFKGYFGHVSVGCYHFILKVSYLWLIIVII